MWSLFHGAISESRWALETQTLIVNLVVFFQTFALHLHFSFFRSDPSHGSPHAEGLVAQVVPTLAHVVQASTKHSPILRVPQRGHNPLTILIQRVIELCMAVNLCLEVLVRSTHARAHTEQESGC